MFVGDEMVLDVGLDAAKASLAKLARSGVLVRASQAAYNEGITGLIRVGPLGSAPGLSRMVEVHFLDLVSREDSALLVLRWEAVGPGGGLFPALDADITLTSAGEHATLLTVAGAYRPPLGILGAALDRTVLHRVAAATVRAFINRVADAIAHPASMAGSGNGIAVQESPRPPAASGDAIGGPPGLSS